MSKSKTNKHSPNHVAYRVVECTLVPHRAFERGLARMELCYEHAASLEPGDEPICLAVVGESRTGKSRLLKEFYERHADARSRDGRSVPILRIRTPATATVGGFVEHALESIGDPSYYSGSNEQKTTRLRKLLKEAGTRVILVDEFQEFNDAANRKQTKLMTNWLKTLVENANVALFVAGLPSCLQTIDGNEQLAGRFQECLRMPRFDWLVADDRGQFMDILDAFAQSIGEHYRLPKLDSDEMAFRFYCATGGLMGYLVKLLRAAVWNAIVDGRGAIKLEHFSVAYCEATWRHADIDPFNARSKCKETPDVLAAARSVGVGVGPDDDQDDVGPPMPSVRREKSINSQLRAR
jgi:hypothetical protein